MKGECSAVLRALEEGGGGAAELRAHLADCPRCRHHEALLAVFAALPETPTDETAVAAILTALPRPQWQLRRVVTWVPAALGGALAAAGLWLLGGVPAGGSVSVLAAPRGVLSWIQAWVLDLATALRTASDAALAVVSVGGPWALAWLLLVGVGGGYVVYALAHRRGGGRG